MNQEEEIVIVLGNEPETTEEKQCECLYEFQWRADGFDMMNPNLCCDVCLAVYKNGL